MGDDLKETDFIAERITEVRDAVRAMMQQDALSQSTVARESGMGVSTLSAFLAGTYAASNAPQALALQRWMTSRLMGVAVRKSVPRGPEFVRTRTSEQIAGVLEHAQFAPDFAVIVGAPGVGKTTTAQAYARNGNNVWMITCHPSANTPTTIVRDIIEALGLSYSTRHGSTLSRIAINRLTGLQSLLIVDEAQNLSSAALDQLRMFHDLAGAGVTLMGNTSIFRRLEGGARQADYAQLFSRVGMRIDRKRPHSDDIEALLDAWQIADTAVRKVARAVARKPGALRAMTKVLRQAHLRANADGGVVTEAIMLAAARQLGDDKPLELGA